MLKRGWERPDFVYVTGDAYVDHSSFGPAIISRVLESKGFKVAMLPQPDWRTPGSVEIFGEPRLGFLVSAGNMDSMVNHYTVNKKRRSEDAYSPGGKIGLRPDNATIVYCNIIRQSFGKIPIIIGGIEASLRRLGHYDYWRDKMARSILLDSGADIISYGMGELSVAEIAEALDSGLAVSDITFVRGTVYKAKTADNVADGIILPSFEEISGDRRRYAESFAIQYRNTDYKTAVSLIEKYGEGRFVVQNPPARPLTTEEMDRVYGLPYMNNYHPMYEKDGGVPAINEVKFSLTSNRGCFGGCSFCALTFHQGRIVQVRSRESIINEAKEMTKAPDFKGYIHDVGGPTANFRAPACQKQLKAGVCKDRQCLFPTPCKNMTADHRDYVALLRELRSLHGVKKVFIRSGIRFDYLLADSDDTFLRELCKYHISGQLRVAPEHVSDNVLALMGKPNNEVFERFCEKFDKINGELGLKQYCVAYLMSSHPGSTLKDAVRLAEYVRDMGYMPEQVQDFYPTPSTISTVMYYTGLDPRTMKPVYVAKSPREKAMQRALIQYKKTENYKLVYDALIKAGRQDLIGYGKKCLIRPGGAGKYETEAGGGKKRRKAETSGSKGQYNAEASGHKERYNSEASGGKGQNKSEAGSARQDRAANSGANPSENRAGKGLKRKKYGK